LDEPTESWDGAKFNWSDEDKFYAMFPDRDDAVLKMVGFEYGESIEHLYFCVDAFSFDAIIEQNKAFGIEASSLRSFFTSFGALLSVQKKLNLTFRIHGAILLGMSPFGVLGTNGIVAKYIVFEHLIPAYNYEEIVSVNGDELYCDNYDTTE